MALTLSFVNIIVAQIWLKATIFRLLMNTYSNWRRAEGRGHSGVRLSSLREDHLSSGSGRATEGEERNIFTSSISLC